MNEACRVLFDYTDFTSFSKLHTDVKTNNCIIYEAQWEETDKQLIFTVKANRFLRNMVRAIVGTLIDVGRGKLTPEDVRKIKNLKTAVMQVLLFLHRLYFFVILNIRNKKTYKMKKIIFLFIISSLISIKGIGLTLSPETEVSILTCAPGNELYSLFGQRPSGSTIPDTKSTGCTIMALSTSLLPIFI